MRVKREDGTPTEQGLAISAGLQPALVLARPLHRGAQAAVAESARNVACTGARPLALTNCLNFGNPEKPEIMWEFAEATRGLGEAAEALGTPVVSGNVSFYNETSGRAIFPTPTIGMVGLLDDWERHAVGHFAEAGLAIVLLGENREELGGSEWLAQRSAASRRASRRWSTSTTSAAWPTSFTRGGRRGLVETAHDVADGGLAVALAECCFGPTGPARGRPCGPCARTIRPDALLFGESTGRVITATEERPRRCSSLARGPRRAGARIGETGGERAA